MKAIIFAGGTGKRLWPLSRENSPKQVHQIFDDKTSLDHSLELLKQIVSLEDIYIATGKKFKNEIITSYPDVLEGNIITESSVKDTGPALAFSLLQLSLINGDEPVLIRWQNGFIRDQETYRKATLAGSKLFASNPELDIVYVALPSKWPNSRVGYIKCGKKVSSLEEGIEQYEFAGFVEKPELELAKELHKGGNAWNTGCYLTTPDRFLRLVQEYAPELYNKINEIKELLLAGEAPSQINAIYDSIEPVSVDYIVSERLTPERTGLVVADYDWWYVSTWDTLYKAIKKENEPNVVKGNVQLMDSLGNLVFNDDNDFVVAVIGANDLCVVKHGNAVLVCPMEQAAKVKDLYQKLSEDEDKKRFV